MAGVKKQRGIQTNHHKFYALQQEWKPVKVVSKKMFGTGYKSYMAAQSIQTGELYHNSHGKIAPWHSIEFTPIKPKELE